MKFNFSKIITLILILTLCLSLFSLFASAETDDNITDTTVDTAEEENIFSLVFDLIGQRSTEIFSALALIASLILAYAYKKGLYPLLKNALGALNGSVEKLKESKDNELEETGRLCEAVKERLGSFEELLDALADKLNTVEEELNTSEANKNGRLNAVLSTQIDLLYDVFMSSSLPQYQKDAVGQRVLKMKEELKEYEKK